MRAKRALEKGAPRLVNENINLAELDRVCHVCLYSCDCKQSVVHTVFFEAQEIRHHCPTNGVLVEVGPSMDMVVRRHRLPDERSKTESMKVAPESTTKKVR